MGHKSGQMTRQRTVSIGMGSAALLAAALILAQAQPAPETKEGLQLTGTIANVSGAPDSIRIELLRWSTEEERQRLMDAWNLKPAPAAAGRGGAGKGAAKAGKGGGGGRGAAKGPAAPPEPLKPEAELARALEEGNTVGYLWSSEVAGYALRYAGRVSAADGSQRIVLLTQRRLGEMTQKWTPVSGTPNEYEFSVIELRLNSEGVGEGKASLTGTVAPDAAAKMVALENYAGLPVVFREVRIAAAQR
jgi:hypothetical protein